MSRLAHKRRLSEPITVRRVPLARRDGSLWSTAWLWVPVVVALALRLAFVSASPAYTPRVHDDAAYDHLACLISQQGAYPPYARNPRLEPSAYRPPVYPYFLAGIDTLTGCDPERTPASISVWPRIAGALLGSAAVALVAWLAARWWGRRAGFAAGALAAIFGPAIVAGSQLLSEQLFTTIMLVGIVAVVQARDTRGRARFVWAVAAGLAGGLAALTRTNGLLLIPLFAAGAWVGRPRLSWRVAAVPLVVMLAAALTIAPWTLRNLRDMHRFILVSDEAGGTLAGTYNDVSRNDKDAPATWQRPEDTPAYRPLFKEADRVHLSEPALQGKLQAAALKYVGEHPGYVAEVAYRNTLRLAGVASHADLLASARVLGLPEWSIRLAWSTSSFALLLALIGAVSGAARGSPKFVWAAVVLLALSTIFVNADALRFQVPFGAFEALLGGAAVASLIDAARRYGSRQPAGVSRTGTPSGSAV
jgi:4-amino-4-deoxy-L-arabinose transferase-like glycosyltransferase